MKFFITCACSGVRLTHSMWNQLSHTSQPTICVPSSLRPRLHVGMQNKRGLRWKWFSSIIVLYCAYRSLLNCQWLTWQWPSSTSRELARSLLISGSRSVLGGPSSGWSFATRKWRLRCWISCWARSTTSLELSFCSLKPLAPLLAASAVSWCSCSMRDNSSGMVIAHWSPWKSGISRIDFISPYISAIEANFSISPRSFALSSICTYHVRSLSRFIGFLCWSGRAKKMYSSPALGGSTQMCTHWKPSVRTYSR
mmetsp:Transcript_4618/g.11894  ORF Transcript_4618/g.11894 Transcript_4618/m.11894 type:complete len:253 (+) Transcript_4618:251-1009(+)